MQTSVTRLWSIPANATPPFLLFTSLGGFQLDNPASWTRGQPFQLFKEMREQALDVTPSRRRRRVLSITAADIKQVELKPEAFRPSNLRTWLA